MIAELLSDFIVKFISSIGYTGIFILMTLESSSLPIPSEVVMPFSGYLAYKGIFNIYLIGIIGTAGCTTGSVLSYYIGKKGGRPLIEKYGKYILIKKKHIEDAEEWFNDYGDRAVLVSRMLPVVRTFISLPAGIGRYDLKKLIIFSFIGSLPWCFSLAYIGFYLGPFWQKIIIFFNGLDIVIVGMIILLMVNYFRKNNKSSKIKQM